MSIAADPCFHDSAAAYRVLERVLWLRGPVCPHCGNVGHAYRIAANPKRRVRYGLWRCAEKPCGKQFTAVIGTPFEASHVPMHKWLQAVYLVTASPTAIGPSELSRWLGVSRKTAGQMALRLEPMTGAFDMHDESDIAFNLEPEMIADRHGRLFSGHQSRRR